jgi:hypothetical protein
MKKPLRRPEILLAVFFAGLVLLAVWSYCEFTASCGEAFAAAADSEACRSVAAQVKKLRAKPIRAAVEARSSTEVARSIEIAAKSANLPVAGIVQIDPQSPRRVGDSSYKEQPTHVEFRGVTLRQLLAFLYALGSEDIGQDLADLRLSSPRDETSSTGVEETWMAELIVTHLIFAP